jgi:hypothetical protein
VISYQQSGIRNRFLEEFSAIAVAGMAAGTFQTIAQPALPGLPPKLRKYKRPFEEIEGPCFASSD